MDWLTDMLGGFSYGFISSITVTIFGSLATIASHLLNKDSAWFTKAARTRPAARLPVNTHEFVPREIRNTLHTELPCRTPTRRDSLSSLSLFTRRVNSDYSAIPNNRRFLRLAGVANSCFFSATRLTKRAQPSAPRPSSFSFIFLFPFCFSSRCPSLTAGSDPAGCRTQVLLKITRASRSRENHSAAWNCIYF